MTCCLCQCYSIYFPLELKYISEYISSTNAIFIISIMLPLNSDKLIDFTWARNIEILFELLLVCIQ